MSRECLSDCVLLTKAIAVVTFCRHVSCGCGTMTLILKAFGPLIRDTINSPPSSGVDFSREERYVTNSISYSASCLFVEFLINFVAMDYFSMIADLRNVNCAMLI